ncbi:mitochondrial import receptor subunit TOM20 homolog [Trichonephila clavata]|uniref:Mitochondrial import receptor subunit TOM20 homolog n=1 Tax=Trichonephila clavata TaxID=2740835 RepID=A0A8X6HD37_TRICU|nr:mitochondrial import receptor subunit TOM20 homolog [Trichonephila clavata]
MTEFMHTNQEAPSGVGRRKCSQARQPARAARAGGREGERAGNEERWTASAINKRSGQGTALPPTPCQNAAWSISTRMESIPEIDYNKIADSQVDNEELNKLSLKPSLNFKQYPLDSIVAAGVCGTLFIGYCIYFDRKRRSDPNFKQNIRDRRAKALMMKEKAKLDSSKIPELRDYESVQKFFIQEVQLGEELLAQGDIENGIEHLSTALAVCGEPQHLIEVLQVQLPPQIFHMLMQRLPIVSNRLANTIKERRMQDEDVE